MVVMTTYKLFRQGYLLELHLVDAGISRAHDARRGEQDSRLHDDRRGAASWMRCTEGMERMEGKAMGWEERRDEGRVGELGCLGGAMGGGWANTGATQSSSPGQLPCTRSVRRHLLLLAFQGLALYLRGACGADCPPPQLIRRSRAQRGADPHAGRCGPAAVNMLRYSAFHRDISVQSDSAYLVQCSWSASTRTTPFLAPDRTQPRYARTVNMLHSRVRLICILRSPADSFLLSSSALLLGCSPQGRARRSAQQKEHAERRHELQEQIHSAIPGHILAQEQNKRCSKSVLPGVFPPPPLDSRSSLLAIIS